MKKLIMFSIMTACVVSMAQSTFPQGSEAVAADIARRAIVEFKSANSGNKIWVLDSSQKTTPSFHEQLKKEAAEAFKAQQQLQLRKLQIKETLGGGWQPEVSEFARYVNGVIYMAASTLGSECTASLLAQKMLGFEFDKNTAIEFDQLSPNAQECLRK